MYREKKRNEKIVCGIFIILMVFSYFYCGKFPNDSKSPDDKKLVRILLNPDALVTAKNESFICSITIESDSNLIAAKLHLYYPPTLIQFMSAERVDSNKIQFFETSHTKDNNFAALSILFASPDVLPVYAPCVLFKFKTLQTIGVDSIYFARPASLTSLRDSLNQAISIDYFGRTKFEIK